MNNKNMSQTLNDYLSFAIRPLQLKAFNHIMYGMTTKSIIYGVIDLKFSSNVMYSPKSWTYKS